MSEESTQVEEVVVPVEDSPSAEQDSTQEVETVVATEETPSSVEEAVEETEGDVDSTPQDESTVEFVETGNEVFDTLGKTITEQGLDPSVYAKELEAQLQEGSDDVALTEESFAELSEKFGESMAKLMETQFVNEYQAQVKQADNRKQEIFKLFGGEEQLTHIADTLRSEGVASEEDLKELGEMLSAGGIQQKAAEKTIKELYMSTDTFEQDPQLLDEGDNAQPVGIQPISRTEYTKAKMEAMNKRDYAAVDALNKRAEYTMTKKNQYWK